MGGGIGSRASACQRGFPAEGERFHFAMWGSRGRFIFRSSIMASRPLARSLLDRSSGPFSFRAKREWGAGSTSPWERKKRALWAHRKVWPRSARNSPSPPAAGIPRRARNCSPPAAGIPRRARNRSPPAAGTLLPPRGNPALRRFWDDNPSGGRAASSLYTREPYRVRLRRKAKTSRPRGGWLFFAGAGALTPPDFWYTAPGWR